jgi:hypothetical protein
MHTAGVAAAVVAGVVAGGIGIGGERSGPTRPPSGVKFLEMAGRALDREALPIIGGYSG